MGKIRRIRVRGQQRKHPDAALIAQAIIQLGREIAAREEQQGCKKAVDEPKPKRPPKPPVDPSDGATS